MGKTGCDLNGNLNETKFSEPLPWIGLYVAVASFACATAMASDLISGFRQRKLWFPSKCFSINATSLTIITVAVKFSVDLNTAMPARVDQLSKLSSSALICTVMSNSMPSLGSMANGDILMNMMALVILVITVIVNICIQLGTGVIYMFWKEHAAIMFIMLILLAILSFSALTVPTTKKYFEFKYKKKYQMALIECSNKTHEAAEKKLRHDLMKYWMMAHTCSPQFVVGRSVTCAAAGALCFLTALILAEAMLHSYLMPRSMKFCIGESDYTWSTMLVLVTQTAAVGVGTIAPAIRWFNAVSFRCPTLGKRHCQNIFKVERYWIQLLLEMKECPLSMRIRKRWCRKLVHDTKNCLLDLCIGMQTGIVVGSKVIHFISVYFVSRILMFSECCKRLNLFKPRNISIDSGSESKSSSKVDLSRFVMHLENENELVDLMMKNNFDATEHWLRRGRRKEPKYLIQLLEKSTLSRRFKEIQEFDSHLALSLDGKETPNCWALPVATLTAIAVALPNVSTTLVKSLIHSVHEGLMYISLIEQKLDAKGEFINIRKAASMVWLGVDLYHKWLDVDLHKLSAHAESTKEILEGLAEAAKHRFAEFKQTTTNQCLNESPTKWPIKVLAANSMHTMSQTILKKHETSKDQMSETLFEAITVMIADILAACLKNIQQVIIQSLSSRIEKREQCVRDAVFLLGKTEKIMKLLGQRAAPNLSPNQMAKIDEWDSIHNQKNPMPSIPSSDKSDRDSRDLYLTIV